MTPRNRSFSGLTRHLTNPWRGTGLDLDSPLPLSDATSVTELLALCPAHAETPLHSRPDLASAFGMAALHIKDERNRMGLGSFKALGAAMLLPAWPPRAWQTMPGTSP